MKRQTYIIGILNVTPDSFSDGGRFTEQGGKENIVEVARQMVKDGATVLDIGGESTHPDASPVNLEGELDRVIPVIKAIHEAMPEVLISVDTRRSEVAEAAIKAGAGMINDVTAGRSDERIADVAAKYDVPLVLMHSKDVDQNTTKDEREYEDVMQTVKEFLNERVKWARLKGVKEIIVDPGMGFFISSNADYSWEIIDRIEELYELDCPVLVGTSRKSFLKEDRFGGTLLTTLQLNGLVDYLRVHDVFENATVLSLTD